MTTSSTTRRRRSRYRIDRPTVSVLMSDMLIPRGDPGPGDKVPRIDLPTTDGGRFTNESIAADGRPLLLVFGSLTCPITESAGWGLTELHRKYGHAVRFVLVNVREAHPGAKVPQPRAIEEKMHNAHALKTHHGLGFEVAVDDIDGTVHRAFGTRPSSAYIIDAAGTIVFRAHWSNSTEAIGQALAAVTAGQAVPRATVGETLRASARMTGYAEVAFSAAGAGAMRDTWRAAPPFAAMIALSRLFNFLPRNQRGLPTIATLLVLSAALVSAAVVLLR